MNLKFEIRVPKFLPGGARNIVFEVPALNHTWGK